MRTFIILFCTTVFSFTSENSFSQVKISIDQDQIVTVNRVFRIIKKQTNYAFIYPKKLFKNASKIQLKKGEIKLTELLNQSLGSNNLKFEVSDNQIITIKENLNNEPSPPKEIVVQQSIEVNGTVSDWAGLPLPGASILEKGTTNGTQSDFDGKFSITVDENAVLVISYLGFHTIEEGLNGRTNLIFELKEDAANLEEIVLIGYGTAKKKNLTGSISQINFDDVQSSAVTNTSSALQGKASGVTIRQNSGLAGEDNSSIKIRGIGTLNAGQTPLVLIDGVEMDMNSIDPMDIKNVSILKDAASASIYGSRAANGVILITTRGGRKNQSSSISYNTYYGIQEVSNLPDMLNSFEHATLYNEALSNDGLPNYFSDSDLNNLQNALHVDNTNFPNNLTGSELDQFNNNGYYQDVDYPSMTFRTAALRKHYLSFEGGGENSSGRLGIGYTNQEGTRIGNESETYNIKLNYSATLLDEKIKVYSHLYYLRKEYDKGLPSSNGNWYVSPWLGFYYPNGFYGGEADLGDLEDGAYDITTKNEIVGLFGTKISLIKNLDIVLEYSQVHDFIKRDQFSPFRVTYNFFNDVFGNNRSELSLESREDFKQTGTATANYQIDFDSKSSVTLLAGTSFEEYTSKLFGASRQDLLNNFQPELNLASAATMVNWSGATDFTLASFFGRAMYNYADRYLFEVNVRRDGSSRFASGNQWGTFPSASFGWRISEEKFMEDATALDNLKLRLSYGQLGNQSIDNYAARDLLIASENGSYPINDALETTVGIGALANKDISWETTTMANIGVDMNFFEQLSLSFDYYNKVSKDVLYRVAIPATVGVNEGPYRNIAEVQNIGWDLSLGWDKRNSKGFEFGAYANVSRYKNEITKLSDNESTVFLDEAFDSQTSSYLYVWEKGQPINSFFGYKVGGIATQEQIDGELIPEQGFDITAGDLWYKDIAGDDNKITDEDRGVIGDPHPDFIYSLNLTAKWKGFDFSLLLEGAQGMDELLYSSMWRPDFRGHVINHPKYLLDRWTVDNVNASIPKLRALTDQIKMSDFYIEDASYLRGKDMTFGYTLPHSFLERIGLSSVRFYANFRNFFLLTNFKGVDPETNDYNDSSKGGNVPPSKVYTLGLQVKL